MKSFVLPSFVVNFEYKVENYKLQIVDINCSTLDLAGNNLKLELGGGGGGRIAGGGPKNASVPGALASTKTALGELCCSTGVIVVLQGSLLVIWHFVSRSGSRHGVSVRHPWLLEALVISSP